MAYTYENFTTAASNAGLLEGFSADDLKIIEKNPEYGLSLLKMRQDAAGATTAEQRLLAQEAENQLRTSYGSMNTSTPGSFQYGKDTIYQKLLSDATTPGSFEYDPSADPSYGAYRKQYLREADRAQQSSMAQAATMSGGVPSTYAITAGQQAGNYYRGQLNDAIPTLQQNAYQRFLSDFEAKQSAFNAISADRTFDYNAYQQEWNNALTLYNKGIQTPEVLAILGIPATPTTGSVSPTTAKKKPADGEDKEEDAAQNNVVVPPAEADVYRGVYVSPTFTILDQRPLVSTSPVATNPNPKKVFANPNIK